MPGYTLNLTMQKIALARNKSRTLRNHKEERTVKSKGRPGHEQKKSVER